MMPNNAVFGLTQQYMQGCALGQQAMMMEASGNIAGAAQAFEQSAGMIASSINGAQQCGLPVMANVFFACAYSNYNAARTKTLAGWGQFAPQFLLYALNAINAAIQVNPNFFQYHSSAGMILLGQGNTQEAMHAFQRALQLNPQDVWSQYMLSMMNAAMGNAAAGQQYYQQAAQNAPNLPPPQQAAAPPTPAQGQQPQPQKIDWMKLAENAASILKSVDSISGSVNHLFGGAGGGGQFSGADMNAGSGGGGWNSW